MVKTEREACHYDSFYRIYRRKYTGLQGDTVKFADPTVKFERWLVPHAYRAYRGKFDEETLLAWNDRVNKNFIMFLCDFYRTISE